MSESKRAKYDDSRREKTFSHEQKLSVVELRLAELQNFVFKQNVDSTSPNIKSRCLVDPLIHLEITILRQRVAELSKKVLEYQVELNIHPQPENVARKRITQLETRNAILESKLNDLTSQKALLVASEKDKIIDMLIKEVKKERELNNELQKSNDSLKTELFLMKQQQSLKFESIQPSTPSILSSFQEILQRNNNNTNLPLSSPPRTPTSSLNTLHPSTSTPRSSSSLTRSAFSNSPVPESKSQYPSSSSSFEQLFQQQQQQKNQQLESNERLDSLLGEMIGGGKEEGGVEDDEISALLKSVVTSPLPSLPSSSTSSSSSSSSSFSSSSSSGFDLEKQLEQLSSILDPGPLDVPNNNNTGKNKNITFNDDVDDFESFFGIKNENPSLMTHKSNEGERERDSPTLDMEQF